jgi:molecular chaperone DnaJ
MCTDCKGYKVKPLEDQQECPACYGSGDNSKIIGAECPSCLGTGLKSISCDSCEGQGLITKTSTLLAKIPKSVDNGMLLRIKGKGHEALNGKTGDLIICIVTLLDKEYTREGNNILSEKKITFT